LLFQILKQPFRLPDTHPYNILVNLAAQRDRRKTPGSKNVHKNLPRPGCPVDALLGRISDC